MAISPDLRTEQGLREYLDSRGVEYIDAKVLSGGYANFVYRVGLKDGKTAIYKHAAGHLQFQLDFVLDPARMDYENRALEILPALLSQRLPNSRVRPEGRYSYDRDSKLLCITDGGNHDLKAAYADQPELDMARIGKELAEWIAALHMCSRKATFSSPDGDLKANNAIAVGIYRHSYSNLHESFTKYGQDADFARYINDEFGSRLETEDECICHGDFWPGNILVNPGGGGEADLTVVDWEMTRRGISATDVGQFAAEAFLLDRLRGGKGLLPIFLNSYLEARERNPALDKVALGREWMRRMIVHWGVHIAFWPTRFPWIDEEGTRELVSIGARVIKAAVDGDWDQLRASELLKDGVEPWTKVWERE